MLFRLTIDAFSLDYKLAINTYLTDASSPPVLPREDVEKVVLESAMSFYDNASNCSRSRGGVKKASDTLVSSNACFTISLSLTIKQNPSIFPESISQFGCIDAGYKVTGCH